MSRKNDLRRLLLGEAVSVRDVLLRVMSTQLARSDVSLALNFDAKQEAIMRESIGTFTDSRS